MNSTAQRAQGGEGLLSQSISVHKPNNPWLKPQSLERRRKEEGGSGGDAWERGQLVWAPGKEPEIGESG